MIPRARLLSLGHCNIRKNADKMNRFRPVFSSLNVAGMTYAINDILYIVISTGKTDISALKSYATRYIN